MPAPTPPPPSTNLVKFLVATALVEAIAIAGCLYFTNEWYGTPFAIDKAWPLWLTAILPIQFALLAYILRVSNNKGQ